MKTILLFLNGSLATLRSYSVSDVHHMNQASENKVSDDSAGAGKFSGGGGM